MTKPEILNHFKNGDVVECLWTKRIMIFDEQKISIQNYHFKNGDVVECEWSKLIGIFNEESLFIFRDDWAFVDKEKGHTIILEHNGQLAKIIQHDKTEVYAQLGKEVEAILKQWPNNDKAGQLIRKLYGK